MRLTRNDRATGIALAASLAVLVLGLCGCASPANRVRASVNAYEFRNARHREVCPGPPACPASAKALQRWDKAIIEAKDALQRGGPMPLQLGALKAAEQAATKAAPK